MSTHCLDCGAEIQDATASRTEGRCVPCSRVAAPDVDPLLSLREHAYAQWTPLKTDANTLLLATFHPGYSSDLTHWETQLQADGAMRQQIMRNNFDRPEVEKGVEERSLRLSPVSLKAIVDAIGNLDIASSQRLCEQATIDDAAMVCITIPTRGFSQCLPLFAFEGYHKRGLLPANSVVGYKSFRDVWDAIDSVSPYSLREHWK